MVAIDLGRQHRGRAQPNRSLSAPKVVEARKRGSNRRHVKRAAVELEYHAVERSTDVRAPLILRHHAVAIAIEIGNRRVRDGDTRRQVELEHYTTRFDVHTSSHEAFISAMRRRDGADDDHCGRHGREPSVYRRANFAP
jgi:hypothetical protein